MTGAIGVPAMVTVAPATGSPKSSRTVPETLWAGVSTSATFRVVVWPSSTSAVAVWLSYANLLIWTA